MPQLSHADLVQTLEHIGQSHVFKFYGDLTPAQQADFDAQLAALDWQLIDQLNHTIVIHPVPFHLSENVQPAPYYAHKPTAEADKKKLCQAFARGEELLRRGQVAVFVVAGGQGTRLGWDGPKGTFPATPIKKKTLFQCFAELILAFEKRYSATIPFYLMTSPVNDAPTRQFWQAHHYFGMKPENVMFFPQESMPAVSRDGQILLQAKDSLALSPNGHGGSLMALHKSGATADMAQRGITQISYFQVDNPIVRGIDPVFLGLHDLDNAQMSSKMLLKAFPKERLGNFALLDGKISVIEYSDLPDHLAEERLGGGGHGELRFRAGSIALHAIRVDFVEHLNRHGFALPFHRAEKKVPCIDLTTGQPVKPDKPNAIKLETFVFDALPLTTRSIIYEADRVDEFGPIKQLEGIDSVVSSHEATTRRNALWLEQAGVKVPRQADGSPDCTIELASSFALYPQDVAARAKDIPQIHPGDQVYLE